MEQQSLSLEGKTILSSSSGPTSPEDISSSPRKTEESPQLHNSGINFSKSDISSSDELNNMTSAFDSLKRSSFPIEKTMPETFKNFLPSPEMLVSFLAKKSHQSNPIQVNKAFNNETTTQKKVEPEDNELTFPINEKSDCWRQFQKAAYAHNLDPNVLALYQQQSPTLQQKQQSDNFVNTMSTSGGSGNGQAPTRRKNATRETTSMLKAWLNEHRKNPYPTKGEKIMLAIITKMSLTQVSTWFANARRRLKKENKVTWAIRSGSHFCDDSDNEERLNDDEDAPYDGSGQKRTMDDMSDTSDISSQGKIPRLDVEPENLSKERKSKIWSLAELAQEDETPVNEEKKEVKSNPIDIARWLQEASKDNTTQSSLGHLTMPSIMAALNGAFNMDSNQGYNLSQTNFNKFDPFFRKLAKDCTTSFSS